MSASEIGLIVEKLNGTPFNYGINAVSFDNFSNDRLLQTLSDVICWINGTEKVDVRSEAADETAIRLLQNLKILKFRPPSDIEQLEEWRAGLVEGSKASVYPVLAYLFSNQDALKQRAYLANFLVKVDIPNELQDPEIVQLQNEVAQLMETFKMVHARTTELSSVSEHVEGIKADLRAMDGEKEQVTRRIERIQTKVKNIPDIDKMLHFAELRRIEAERVQSMEAQKTEQRPVMIQMEKKMKRLEGVLEELRRSSESIDQSEMIKQLKEEMQTNSYLVNEKLSKEVEAKIPVVAELSKVVHGPAIDEDSIQRLQNEIDATSMRIREMVEDRDKKEESHDDNFTIYRHQTANIERKKAATAQKLQDARQELSSLEAAIAEKKSELRERSGGSEVVTSVQFKNYVNKMRVKTNEFKKKRAELDGANAENNVLSRTSQILSKQWNNLRERIEDMGGDVTEVSVAVPSTFPARPRTAAPRTDDSSELRAMLRVLSERHSERSSQLAPLRARHSEATASFNEKLDALRLKKKEYERRKAALESGQAQVKQDVEEMETRQRRAAEKSKDIEEKLRKVREQRHRLESEHEGAPSILADIQEKIMSAQSENDSQMKSGGPENDLEAAKRQRLMWAGLAKLFECKLQLIHEDNDNDQIGGRPLGDRMP